MILHSRIWRFIGETWLLDEDGDLILDIKKAHKSAVYIPIISARKSWYKKNPSTMIYSGDRKGYPIWFAPANFRRNQSQRIP